MKPNELIKKDGKWNDCKGHADVEKKLSRYMEKDCIIAYFKEKFTSVFIIKGKMKYFAFVYQNPELYYGGYGYNLTCVSLKDALRLMGDEVVITDNDLFGRLRKTMIVEAL